MQLFWRLSMTALLVVCEGYGQTYQGNPSPFVSAVIGEAFAVSKENPELPPKKLDQNDSIVYQAPFSLVTSKDSFLEIKHKSFEQPYTMRIGKAQEWNFVRILNFIYSKDPCSLQGWKDVMVFGI